MDDVYVRAYVKERSYYSILLNRNEIELFCCFFHKDVCEESTYTQQQQYRCYRVEFVLSRGAENQNLFFKFIQTLFEFETTILN